MRTDCEDCVRRNCKDRDDSVGKQCAKFMDFTEHKEICGETWYYGKYVHCERKKGHKGDHGIKRIGCCYVPYKLSWKGSMTDYDKNGLKKPLEFAPGLSIGLQMREEKQ